MKFFAAFAIVLLAGLLSARAQQNADDQYIGLYGSIQQADGLAGAGQPQQALNQYVEVQGELQKFQKIFPDWNPPIVKFRLKYLAGKIADLTAQVPAVAPTNPPPNLPPPASVATNANANPVPENSTPNSDAELASLRAQLRSLQSDNTMLEAKLKEALAAQPAMVDAGELSKAQAQIQSLLKENALLKAGATEVHPQTILVADTNALAQAQAQIQSLTQENESLKNNLAQEKIDETNAMTAAAVALARSQQALTDANGKLDDQTARADKLAAANGELQTRIQALLTSPDSLAALHDENALLDDMMPEFVARRPKRYHGQRLRDLCADMHAFFRDAGVSALQKAQFHQDHIPDMAMTPREASRHLVRNTVDYVPLDELEGRIATTLFVVYPPGIATIVPGERLSARAKPMVDYLKTFERAANLFPGFEAEIQGLYREVDERGAIRFRTYVVKE